MWGFVRKIFRQAVYMNLIIATAAVAQCALTYLILGIEVKTEILAIEGTSTLLLYHLSLFLSKPQHPEQSPFARTRWFFARIGWMYLLAGLSCIALIYCLFKVAFYTVVFLGFIGMLSLAYNIPVLRSSSGKINLRRLPALKIFHIALLWSLSTVGLPVIEAWSQKQFIDWEAANYLGLIKIMFIIICTLPFDVRDIKQDSYYNLKTIPTLVGKENSITINYVLLLTHTLFILFAPYLWQIKLGLIVTNLFIFLILKSVIYTTKQQDYDAVYLLDVAMIFQFLFTCMAELYL